MPSSKSKKPPLPLEPLPTSPAPTSEIIWKVDKEGNLRAYHSKELNKPVVWAPQPGPQELFLQCPLPEVLFSGTRGNGKTDCLLMDFVQHVGTGLGEDWRGILFRRTFPELKDVIAKANKWFPQIFPTAKYNKAEHVWTFQDGEQLIFGFVEKEEDYWRYHGFSFPWIGWEELTNWPTDTLFKRMMSTNRSSTKKVPRKIRATCNPHGCVPYGDVLTTDGWVAIKDVTTAHKVVSADVHGDIVVSQVTKLHEYDFDGSLVHSIGRWDTVFTPNHRWPLLLKNNNGHTHTAYEDLPNTAILRRSGNKNSWVGITDPVQKVYPGHTRTDETREILTVVPHLLIEEYAELLGWYAAEGSASKDRQFEISQVQLPGRTRIRNLLNRCKFRFSESDQAFYIAERYWARHFSQFGHSGDKFLPRWFLNQPTHVLKICFDAMMLGDGCETRYYTKSKQLSDDVEELLVKIGWSVSRGFRYDNEGNIVLYVIGFLERGTITMRKHGRNKNVELRPYKGKVYCISVKDTEAFFLRQGRTIQLSSNSGHNWVKARYELPVLPGQSVTKIIDNGTEPPRVAIHGTIHENKILLHADPDYIMKLKASCSSPAEEAAWIDGSWDITSGGMFDDIWDRNIHILQGITPQMIPKRWLMDRSYDHGQSKPFSVGWWAQSNGEPLSLPSGQIVGQVRGDLIRIQEWYGWDGTPDKGLRMTAAEIAIGIRERQREMGIDSRVRPGVADGSIFDQWEPGKSIQGDMRKKGVKWLRADKGPGTRIQGWQQCRKLLKQAIPVDNYRDLPGLFVSDLCIQFLRTFPILSRDKRNPDDVDTKIEDHIADEVRYRCRAKQAKRTKMFQG